jgi:phosphoenolpyruvate-protein kinase (PTS system EI component)
MNLGVVKTENSHKEETVLRGIPASPGISIGPVFVYVKHTPVIEERSILAEEVEHELGRLE